MAKTNQEILEQIESTSTAEYQARVSELGGLSRTGVEMMGLFDEYPTAKNEFINALTNKIIKSLFYAKVFENPLKMFHRGMLPYGSSIEHIFVEMAEKKGFKEHFNGSSNAEQDLISPSLPNVKVGYSTVNYQHKYKVSISDQQLKHAFTSEYGLSKLIGDIIASEVSGAYYDEYTDMRNLLKHVAQGQQYGKTSTGLATPVAIATSGEVAQPLKTVVIGDAEANPKLLAKQVRALSGRLKFPSTEYNMAGVKTFSNKEDLVLITTPEMVANLDVEVLANAFNVSKGEVSVRIVEVDELPSNFKSTLSGSATAKTCYGILADKDFLQAYDTVNTTKTFDNGDQLTTNMFLHKHGIYSCCYFANAVALIKE